MGALNNIVNISITRNTQTVSKANFGTILLVYEDDTATSPFTTRTKEYASLDELSDDGFSSGDYVYDAAQKIFSQNPKVTKIKVGLKKITTTPDASWTAAMAAIRDYDTDWYGFSTETDTSADQVLIAGWAEAQEGLLYFARTTDANTLDPVATTDIGYLVSQLGYDRTIVYYNSSSNAQYIECAAMGEAFPYNPGSQTWAFKTLSGVTKDKLTSSERQAALDKNVNVYTEVAGVNITEQGVCASGEYIDVMRGVDWIQSNIQEEIFTDIINTRKIPFTDEGTSIVIGTLKGILNLAVTRSILRDGTVEVTYPLVEDVSSTNRGNRLLPDVDFTAELAGAIHKVSIAGTLSV